MYRPAGAEESDSSDDGFYMGSIHSGNDKYSMNGGINNKTASPRNDSRNTSSAMPAGAEFDDEDSDGYEFGSVNSVKSAPAQFNTTRTVNNDRQFGKTNDVNTSNPLSSSLSETTVTGRGRGLLQQKGRGRGGFPRPPPSFNNKGKSAKRFIYCRTYFQ